VGKHDLFSHEMLSLHVKRSLLLWLHNMVPFAAKKFEVKWIGVSLVFRQNK